ncbi:MAG: retropepsin-like domain-containing protein [Anaerolineae bacterium]|nr:retropepsin-like domain-containing protein [Phycisphaerae bacterium]
MPLGSSRRSLALLLAALPVATALSSSLALAAAGPAPAKASPTIRLSGLSSLWRGGHVTLNPAAAAAANDPSSRTFTMLPLNAPPINGFQPNVVLGLTDQQDPDDFNFTTKIGSSPGGNTLPRFAPPRYSVGIFDTGSQAHYITLADAQGFDIEGANRMGSSEAVIGGVSGTEIADVSDGLGVYIASLGNASAVGSTISVAPGSLKGQWNAAILSAQEADSVLPNIIGSPMAAQYQTVIRNSQTRHLTVGSRTYRGPSVTLQAKDTALPAGYSRLTLGVESVNGVSPDPVFFPSLENINNVADNPATPTFWASLIASVNANHSGGSANNQGFLFDTGAEVTVVSQDTAASVGFFSGGPNPSTPDFFVTVSGVGGTTTEVPGFYMNNLSITTNGGPIAWTHVPVLVLDIPDPRDGVGFIPGVLGMNLFTDRDLILNGGTGNPFLGIGPIITQQWTAPGGGTWGDDTKWALGSPNNPDVPANFLSSITTPSTITVEPDGVTVGSMKFDNANRYTIAGPGTITISAQSTGVGAIEVISGSHTISAPMVLASNTTINVAPSSSTLTISGNVNGGSVALTKIGAGAVLMNNVRAGTLALNAGTLAVATNGTNAGASRVTALSIAGGASPTATLDLNDNDLLIENGTYAAVKDAIAFARHSGAWDRPGLTSSAARNSLPKNKTLGTLTGADYLTTGTSTFNSFPVTSGNVLVKYTYYGDTDFNGLVDFDDYARVDAGFNNNRTGWFNGDVDYNNIVDFDDYSLIDMAFNTQSGTLRRAMSYLDGGDRSDAGMDTPALQLVEVHFAQFGYAYATSFLNAVPEPSTAAIALLTSALVIPRKRRR